MSTAAFSLPAASRWELAAENIAVKIRWFGLIVGYLFVNLEARPGANVPALNAILTLGLAYALVDTFYSYQGRVFLARHPLAVSLMESVFIGLLCHCDAGLDSPFRYYYLLSLVCCAIRHPPRVTFATGALHSASYALLVFSTPTQEHHLRTLLLMLVVLGWVAWAATALATLLKRAGEHLGQLNDSLQQHQSELEERIRERTRQLQETQAHLLHQEKMAAFGLLAAGIAHEVGNPLASISSLVQLVQRRSGDEYVQQKLGLVSGQLQRIQHILRELVNFSRPATTERTWTALADVVREALDIAKYYKRTRGKTIATAFDPELPMVFAARDQLVQAVLNLVLNAIDATESGGRIEVRVRRDAAELLVEVADNGQGIAPGCRDKLFQPYFTTKPHGTGLGLFVTHRLVTEHGGRVSHDSTPGAGAVFRIHLPLPGRAENVDVCSVGARVGNQRY